MTLFRVVIKGDRFDASQAAIKRGLTLLDPRTFEAWPDFTTLGYIETDSETLNAWLCEETQPPFPKGSLLFWRHAS